MHAYGGIRETDTRHSKTYNFLVTTSRSIAPKFLHLHPPLNHRFIMSAEESTKKVIMVTGGSGLVGSGIRMYVEQSDARRDEEWVFLSSREGDLRDRKDTEAIFEKYKPTHVIHLAAKVGGLFANMSQKTT